MNDQQLLDALGSVSQRYRRIIVGTAMAGTWGIAALGGVALRQWLHGADYQVPLFAAGYSAALGLALTPVLISWLRKTRDPVWLAHKIEKRFPELDTRLLAAIEQPDKGKDGAGFLQQMVISQAISHSRRTGWDQMVSNKSLRAARFASVAMMVAAILAGTGVIWEGGKIVIQHATGQAPKPVVQDVKPFDIQVDAEKEVERDTPWLVTATFGNGRLPASVTLLYREKDAETQTVDMSKSALNDPKFATRLSSVKRDMEFAIRYDDKQTDWQSVKVFEFPQLKQADAHLKYPDFTGPLPEKDIPNTRIVTAVEGTNATLTFKLNKSVAEATLVPTPRTQRTPTTAPAAGGPLANGGPGGGGRGAGGRGGRGGRVGALAAQNGRGAQNDVLPDGVGAPNITLTKDPNDPTAYTVKMDMLQSQLYTLQLVDSDKRANREKPTMALNVTRDNPAVVRLTAPSRDVEVSPLEELTIKGQVSDDFGVKRAGITYTMRGEQKEVVLVDNVAAKERRDFATIIAMEDLNAKPDELLSYNLWAEDIGPDGKVRRTMGDMFFAEVRPFEEIYRQGQPQAEGQGQQQQQQQQQQGNQQQQQAAQRAEDVTNQLKQIIAAMWTVLRREVAEKVTTDFVPDMQAIEESQAAVIESAGGLDERVTDEKARVFLESGMKNLNKAADLMKSAEGVNVPAGPNAKPLNDALAAEQAAYDDFLKLRERQFQVVRNNRQGQQGNTAQARRQQQLNQLDLQDQQNRYQTQRQAQQAQEEQDRQARQAQQNENRQVLNRLRDLAQRQDDLNRQMRETQAALQEAQNQQQREELQRQLARLQEQQQQQLQDTDELQQRLDEPQNQENLAQARENVDQARQNVQQSAQALQQGRAADAAAAGQRASEQLAQAQDQVRRQSANQFTDTMQQMRQDARALEQGAQENNQQLAALDQQASNPDANAGAGLRDPRAQAQQTRQQVASNLTEQRQQLEKLLQNMQQTVQDAETAEPLLSRQLYDTYRQAQQSPPEKALDTTQELVREGFTQQARQTNEEATKGLTKLREGVEQAAASVLGDDTESLRRAQADLDAISQQLEREIGRNIQEQQQLAEAQAQTRPGGGRNQNPQLARAGRGAAGTQPGQNGGQNPDDRQLANAGGRGGPQGADTQPGGNRGGQRGGAQANAGQRGGRGQQPGETQPGGGQPDERQLAQNNGEQPGADGQQPGADGQQPGGNRGGQRSGGAQANAGQRGGRGQQPGDPQVADGQNPDEQQPGAAGARGGNRGGQRGGAGGQQPGDPQAADAQNPDGQQPGRGGNRGQPGLGRGLQPGGDPQQAGGQRGGNRGGQRGGAGGQQPGDQPGNPGDPQVADAQNPDGQTPDAQNPDGQQPGQAGGNRGGQRGGAGLRGGTQQARGGRGGGPQDPQNPQDQQPQDGQVARGGAGGNRNVNINPLQAGGGGGIDAPSVVDPLTGGGYRNFSDTLRDVQDLVNDPQLRAQAQQIRERASAVRVDVTRHSAPPNWNMVSETIGKPLAELRQKVSEELLKRDKAQAALVPLDREPVPPEYQDQVKQYYEKLGSGK